MTNKSNFFDAPVDLSLALGGPLYQLYRRTRLSGSALELLHRRIIAFALITWLPLVLLTALAGHLVSGVQVPFLFSVGTHVRFLGALPLLLAAELFVHAWSRSIVREFLDRGLIAPEDRPRFDSLVASALRLRNSVSLELLLLVVAVAMHWAALQLASPLATWYDAEVDDYLRFTPAGYWLAFVSLPLFRFLVVRWYFRLFIWYRFLWQVARLPLRLNTLHPDRAGGLEFLAQSVFAFTPVLLAHTVVLSGGIAYRLWYAGARLPDFKLEVLGILIFLVLLVLVPLTFFIGQLTRAKYRALLEYGSVASDYVRDFRDKWIEGHNPEEERLLGSADIQSLADLGNSFAVVRETRVVPFSKENVVTLAIIIVVPLLPLIFMVIPLNEVVNRLVGIVW